MSPELQERVKEAIYSLRNGGEDDNDPTGRLQKIVDRRTP